ncbi:MAG: hypothetical protein VKJ64_11015 [Leptolyngbyaceae bacterium]|nr:hypothetical protein [Leptolyngbyaceae bacterium]
MAHLASAIAPTQIRPITSAADRELFLDVPYHVYAHDPNWVAPLRSTEAKYLAEDNPFLDYGSLQGFIAIQDGCAVGRIVASVNQRLIEKEGYAVGLFGFFECVEDGAIATALFDHACDWLRQQGMTHVRGPINLSTHNRCLFLVDGFDTPPMIMMPYNPPYYPQFVEQNGWVKARDAYAYRLDLTQSLDPKYEKGYRIACRSGIQFRNLNLKGDAFWQDVDNMYHLFTTTFANNWSSTPRTLEDFREEAKELQSVVDPDIFWIAEYEGKMVGFFMALPDYNIPLRRVKGRLNVWGLLKFLWYRRQINQGRVVVICALPEHRRRMVPLGLIYLGMTSGTKKSKPYQQAELGYIYEDNLPSRHVTEATGATIYKTYRAYEKAL